MSEVERAYNEYIRIDTEAMRELSFCGNEGKAIQACYDKSEEAFKKYIAIRDKS